MQIQVEYGNLARVMNATSLHLCSHKHKSTTWSNSVLYIEHQKNHAIIKTLESMFEISKHRTTYFVSHSIQYIKHHCNIITINRTC